LILDDVIWSQPTYDYTFANGAIIIRDDVLMTGDHVFAYQSSQTSTINARAQLMLDSNFTFSYAPSSASRDLIAFVDGTSQLVLNGATLHTTTTGMNLTKGQLVAHGISHLSSDADITVGDLILADDFSLFIDAGAQLVIDSGTLNYKNMAVGSLTLLNDLSELYFAPNTTLHLYESMTYSRGRTIFSATTTQVLEPGAVVDGSFLYL